MCPYVVLHSLEVLTGCVVALCKLLLCLKVIARCLGSGYGLILGRQAAWRPGKFGLVSSRLLAALCKHLLCLKVIARCLGSGYGLKSGREAAWRPGRIGMVSSGWLATLNKFLVDPGSAVLVGLRASTAGPFRCPRGRCSPVQKLCSSSEDSNDGKELLRHRRQSKRMEYTVLAGVVHLSARLMVDAADGFLCDEEPQWRTANVCRSRTTRQDWHVASVQDTMFFIFWVKTHP